MSAIDILNTWSNFVRAYYFSCLIDCRGRSGGRVSAGRRMVRSDPLGFAITLFRPSARPNSFGGWHRRDEPAWHDPYTLTHLAQQLSLSNEPDIRAAFSIGSRVFSDLPVFRNYFAHRNENSLRAVVNLAALNGVATRQRPWEMLVAVPLTRPQSLLLDWVDDLLFTAEYLCD